MVLLGGGLAFAMLNRQPQEVTEETKATPIPERYNLIEVSERPYVMITPSANGRNITLMVDALKFDAKKGEYEIEYQTGNLLQGAGGRVDVTDLPQELDILLGSCSAGGKCSYHEDVTGGTLKLRFEVDGERTALKNDWAFIENEAGEDSIASRDGKFGITAAGLETVDYAIVMQSPGLPENPETPLLSDPYSVATATAVRGGGEVRIRMNEASETATILAWDGSTWTQLETTVEEKMATAEFDTWYDAYVVVAAE